MADYMDIGYNIQRFVGDIQRSAQDAAREKDVIKKAPSERGAVDPAAFLRVRDAVCVVGRDRQTVAFVKNRVGQLLDEPFAIEGFHCKTTADLKDGALLVPKLILVARHCPGRKLLDDDGDEGQLDFVYDEAVEMEADVMVIYTDLPRSIYKPMRHIVHHPKLAETVFPTQPLLRRLATNNCLVTLTEQAELNNLQKNVIREWLTKPVGPTHPVYKVADLMSDVELSRSGCHNFDPVKSSKITYYRPTAATSAMSAMSSSTSQHSYDPSRHMSSTLQYEPYNAEPTVNFVPATEEHPLADKKSKKKKRKDRKDKKVRAVRSKDMGTLEDLVDDLEPGMEMNSIGKTNLAFTAGQSFSDFV